MPHHARHFAVAGRADVVVHRSRSIAATNRPA
jgi:hypothetical protein